RLRPPVTRSAVTCGHPCNRRRATIGQTNMQRSLRWLLLGAVLLSGCVIHRSLSRDQILEHVRRDFPIERRKSLFYVRLQNPDLSFPGGNRMGVRLEVEAGAPLVKHIGHAAVEGAIDFHDGGLYLKDTEMR